MLPLKINHIFSVNVTLRSANHLSDSVCHIIQSVKYVQSRAHYIYKGIYSSAALTPWFRDSLYSMHGQLYPFYSSLFTSEQFHVLTNHTVFTILFLILTLYTLPCLQSNLTFFCANLQNMCCTKCSQTTQMGMMVQLKTVDA